MLRIFLKNQSANGGPSISTEAYQIDRIEAIGILGWEF